MRDRYHDLFPSDTPRLSDLPTNVYHRFKLKDPNLVIIYIKAIWVIDQVGLQVGLRALNDRVRMNFMCEKPTKAII